MSRRPAEASELLPARPPSLLPSLPSAAMPIVVHESNMLGAPNTASSLSLTGASGRRLAGDCKPSTRAIQKPAAKATRGPRRAARRAAPQGTMRTRQSSR
eukprot:7238664-Prymnesium_polylepis.1